MIKGRFVFERMNTGGDEGVQPAKWNGNGGAFGMAGAFLKEIDLTGVKCYTGFNKGINRHQKAMTL